jgi:hypothetical protein
VHVLHTLVKKHIILPIPWLHQLMLSLLVNPVKNYFKGKVHIFWEGYKILRNLHLTFVLCSASQK